MFFFNFSALIWTINVYLLLEALLVKEVEVMISFFKISLWTYNLITKCEIRSLNIVAI